MNPALSHARRMVVSSGTFASSQSWSILSKHALMLPSSTHCGLFPFPRKMKHASMASAVERSFLNPYESRSPVVSAIGSRACR